MNTKNCFFIGHREASEEIYLALYAAVAQHISEYPFELLGCRGTARHP